MNSKARNVVFYFLFVILFVFACNTKSYAQASTPANVRKQPSANAIAEWQNQKFSMFIHFGLYSIPAGIWKNETIDGYSEQIRAHGKITKEDYSELAKSFNIAKWNPDSIAILAKQAGMKSIVITAKHHDGFAMYDTKYSDFNIVDATPYKRDVVKELAEACKRQGLKFGVYFSIIDWNFANALPMSKHNSDSIPDKHHAFNLHQIEELMTNYGPISEIWFDMGKPTAHQSKELAEVVRRYQPDCLISGRIWNDKGDFAVMGDNTSPNFQMGTLWQTPASMFNETWGYRSWQIRENPKDKALEKLASLISVVSNGGNYLLNIGPRGDGSIVPFEREVLSAIGSWLNRYGEAIYSTTPLTFQSQDWGVITGKPQKLFLIITKPPKDGNLILKGIRSKPIKVYPLSGPSKLLSFTHSDSDCKIDISNLKSEDIFNVIALEYKGELDYIPSKGIAPPYHLTAANAINYHSLSGSDYYSTKPTIIKKEWFIDKPDKGKYRLIFQSTPKCKGKRLRVKINEKQIHIVLDGKSGQYAKNNFTLKPGKRNTIQISLADQSNPNKDMEVAGLILSLEK